MRTWKSSIGKWWTAGKMQRAAARNIRPAFPDGGASEWREEPSGRQECSGGAGWEIFQGLNDQLCDIDSLLNDFNRELFGLHVERLSFDEEGIFPELRREAWSYPITWNRSMGDDTIYTKWRALPGGTAGTAGECFGEFMKPAFRSFRRNLHPARQSCLRMPERCLKIRKEICVWFKCKNKKKHWKIWIFSGCTVWNCVWAAGNAPGFWELTRFALWFPRIRVHL